MRRVTDKIKDKIRWENKAKKDNNFQDKTGQDKTRQADSFIIHSLLLLAQFHSFMYVDAS